MSEITSGREIIAKIAAEQHLAKVRNAHMGLCSVLQIDPDAHSVADAQGIAASEILRLRQALAAEREECAKVAEGMEAKILGDYGFVASAIAAAIRSRKEKGEGE